MQNALSWEEWNQTRTNMMRQIAMHSSQGGLQNLSVVLAENHHRVRTNANGEPVLPNGTLWVDNFLTLTVLTSHLTMARRVPTPKGKGRGAALRGGRGSNDPSDMIRRMMVRALPARLASRDCAAAVAMHEPRVLPGAC